MATLIRVNPAASPQRNVTFSGMASASVGDVVDCRLELTGDARSGATGYTPSVFVGTRGNVLGYGADYVASGAGWNFTLHLDTAELAEFVGPHPSSQMFVEVVVQADSGANICEAQCPITIFRRVSGQSDLPPIPATSTQSLAASITAEQSRALAAEGGLVAEIDAEVLARESADLSLAGSLLDDVSTLTAADLSLDALIDGEVARAVSVEAALSTAIVAEASTRSVADLSLASAISAANSARSTADISLAAAITAEVSSRTALASSIATSVTTGAVTCSGTGTFSAVSISGGATVGGILDAAYVRIGTDTQSGNTIINGPSGVTRPLTFRTAGKSRAVLFIDQVAELGSNSGSDLRIDLHDDAGNWRANWLKVVRASGAWSTIGDWTQTGNASISGSLTVAGTTTFTGPVNFGTDTGARGVILNGPAGSNRLNVARTAGVDRWSWGANNSVETGSNAGSNFSIDAKDDAGAYLFNVFSITRATGVVNCPRGLTAANIEVVPEALKTYTTAQILALSAAESARRRVLWCSDCYSLDGTLTGGLAVWRGTSSAGSWVLAAASDVPVTTSAETFARAVLVSSYVYSPTPQGDSWGSGTYKLNVDRFVPCAITNDAAGLVSLTTGASIATVLSGQIERAVLITLGATANASFVSVANDLRFPIWKAVNTATNCAARFRHAISAVGFAAESAALAFGMIQVGQNFGATTRTIAAIVDPANLYGFGVANSNIHLIVHNGTSFTLQDTLVAETVSTTLADVTFVRLGASTVRAYRNGVQLGNDITTTIPDLSFAMHAFFCGKRGASAGTLAPVFRPSEMSSVQISP